MQTNSGVNKWLRAGDPITFLSEKKASPFIAHHTTKGGRGTEREDVTTPAAGDLRIQMGEQERDV